MSRTKRQVVVTGMGVVSPIGSSTSAFFGALVDGRSGIRHLPDRQDVVAGLVDFAPEQHFNRLQLASLDRFSQFGLVAADQAVGESNLDPSDFAGSRSAVYFGSGIGGANALESGFRSFFDPQTGRVPPMTTIATMANAAAAHISMKYGIHGPTLTYSVACASSAIAIGEAYRAISDGYIDLAIAGGAEALLTPGMVAGWSAMKVLASPDRSRPETSCRPFSRDRTGLVLGEGAAVLILENRAGAEQRGRRILAEVAGYGMSSDASHITKPNAEGQATALREALADAGLAPAGIGYINAHGTATKVGDSAETAAIKLAFGGAASCVPVTSTKALHGHLLGAAGALEFVASILAMNQGTIPPTCHLGEADPECDLDYVPNEARRGVTLDAVMSNSFAFGGMNAVLIARRSGSG